MIAYSSSAGQVSFDFEHSARSLRTLWTFSPSEQQVEKVQETASSLLEYAADNFLPSGYAICKNEAEASEIELAKEGLCNGGVLYIGQRYIGIFYVPSREKFSIIREKGAKVEANLNLISPNRYRSTWACKIMGANSEGTLFIGDRAVQVFRSDAVSPIMPICSRAIYSSFTPIALFGITVQSTGLDYLPNTVRGGIASIFSTKRNSVTTFISKKDTGVFFSNRDVVKNARNSFIGGGVFSVDDFCKEYKMPVSNAYTMPFLLGALEIRGKDDVSGSDSLIFHSTDEFDFGELQGYLNGDISTVAVFSQGSHLQQIMSEYQGKYDEYVTQAIAKSRDMFQATLDIAYDAIQRLVIYSRNQETLPLDLEKTKDSSEDQTLKGMVIDQNYEIPVRFACKLPMSIQRPTTLPQLTEGNFVAEIDKRAAPIGKTLVVNNQDDSEEPVVAFNENAAESIVAGVAESFKREISDRVAKFALCLSNYNNARNYALGDFAEANPKMQSNHYHDYQKHCGEWCGDHTAKWTLESENRDSFGAKTPVKSYLIPTEGDYNVRLGFSFPRKQGDRIVFQSQPTFYDPFAKVHSVTVQGLWKNRADDFYTTRLDINFTANVIPYVSPVVGETERLIMSRGILKAIAASTFSAEASPLNTNQITTEVIDSVASSIYGNEVDFGSIAVSRSQNYCGGCKESGHKMTVIRSDGASRSTKFLSYRPASRYRISVVCSLRSFDLNLSEKLRSSVSTDLTALLARMQYKANSLSITWLAEQLKNFTITDIELVGQRSGKEVFCALDDIKALSSIRSSAESIDQLINVFETALAAKDHEGALALGNDKGSGSVVRRFTSIITALQGLKASISQDGTVDTEEPAWYVDTVPALQGERQFALLPYYWSLI